MHFGPKSVKKRAPVVLRIDSDMGYSNYPTQLSLQERIDRIRQTAYCYLSETDTEVAKRQFGLGKKLINKKEKKSGFKFKYFHFLEKNNQNMQNYDMNFYMTLTKYAREAPQTAAAFRK